MDVLNTASIIRAIALMMETAITFETSVNVYETTWCNIPKGSHLYTPHCDFPEISFILLSSFFLCSWCPDGPVRKDLIKQNRDRWKGNDWCDIMTCPLSSLLAYGVLMLDYASARSRVTVPSATGIIRQSCRSPTKWTVDIGFTLALLVHTLTKCC